jgi:predicted phage terminase large subunit-like protein
MLAPATREASIAWYRRVLDRAIAEGIEHEVERELVKNDLFYLLTVVLGRRDVNRDWLFARCREVETASDGYLDLWAREHYKSTILTFGLTIRDILRDPEITVGIFSFNRPTAKAFLRQIKREFEDNERLRSLFPDVLWEHPHREAPKWSEDDGIIVRRQGNPKESTVEAWGLVDGQPTSKHFRLRVYDDVVTADSVTTPEMIEKVTRAWEVSLNLGTEGGVARYIGTRWHYNDTYRQILERGAATERRHPVTIDGTVEGEPVLWSRELVAQKRRDMGMHTFGAQMLLDPAADRTQGFKEEWIRFYPGGDLAGANKYLLVDPASERKKKSDYTAMAVIALGSDENYYLVDAVRDRLSLKERADAVFALHRRWKPKGVGYEHYGMQADVEYLRERMAQENYRFDIQEVGGQVAKPDRIRRLIPIFEAGRFYLPETLWKVDYEGRHVDLVQAFLNDEYRPFPVGLHDDLFDAMSRIWDIATIWPKPVVAEDRYVRPRHRPQPRSYMAA